MDRGGYRPNLTRYLSRMRVKASILRFAGLFCLLGSSTLFAGEDWQPQVIGPFGTLNNSDNSYAIPSTSAQDLLNIDLLPEGKSFKKRDGYSTAFTLAITTAATHGVYKFFDSSGNEVALFFNDTRITSSVNGGAATVIYSTGPAGATYQCTDSLGFAYCVNTSRTALFKTNGQTVSTISGVSSTGTMVATAVTRLAMAGFSDRPSAIDFSADTDFTTWGTGSLGTSAAQFTINAPGYKITHITYAFGRLMWFKDSSFGFIITGNQPAQSDWVVKTVAYDLGTNDNSSIYREGILYFRGQDAHFYAFDGTRYERMTRDINGTIAEAQTRRTNSWTQTTQSDWSSGDFAPSLYVDTVTTSGSIRFDYPDDFTTFRDGSGGTKDIWDFYCRVSCSSNASVSGGNLVLTVSDGTAGVDQIAKTVNVATGIARGTSFYFTVNSMATGSNPGKSVFTLSISSVSTVTADPTSLANNYFFFQFNSTTSNKMYLSFIKSSTDLTLFSGNAPTGGITIPATINIFVATTTYAITANSVLISSGTHTYPNYSVYSYLNYFSGDAGSHSIGLGDFSIAPESSTFRSAVTNTASAITSWDAFNATVVNGGGSHTFYIRASTNSFTVTSSTPSWTAITIGAIPSISTGTYIQIRDDIIASGVTDTPRLDDFTVNWLEGNAADKVYGGYFDDALWWNVQLGGGSSYNNYVLKYDLINQGWVLYDIPMNGFYVKNNDLYFGSSVGGYIYKFGDATNDNGSAINAYWKSKDYFGANPFTTQELANISIAAKSVANSTMTVTYTLNGSSSTSYTSSLYNANSSFLIKNKNLPAGTNGNTYSVQVGNNAADQPFEIFAIQVGIRPKSWIPTP